MSELPGMTGCWFVLCLCRVEKERNQLKSELDDIQSQLEHVSKGKVTSHSPFTTAIISYSYPFLLLLRYTRLKGAVQRKKKFKKNPRLLWKWVGGSRSHSELFWVENHPKIPVDQYRYIGVVYHMYSVCISIVKKLLVIMILVFCQCQWCVSKKSSDGGGWVGGWGELYPSFFWGFFEFF